jgi:hypothetical protein
MSGMSPVRTLPTPYPPSPLFSGIFMKKKTLLLLASRGLTDKKRLTRRRASENRHFSSGNAQSSTWTQPLSPLVFRPGLGRC